MRAQSKGTRVRASVEARRAPAVRRRPGVIVGVVVAGAALSTTVLAAVDRIDEAATVTATAHRVTPPTTPPGTPPPGGFPTRSSAGVPAGWSPVRTVNGNYTASTAGQVVEDLRINGSLIVTAANVTVRRVEVVGGFITNHTGPSCAPNMIVEDSTIRKGAAATDDGGQPALGDGSYTARNVKIENLPEGFRVGGKGSGCGPVTIENSYAYVTAPDSCTDWHGDGVQGYDGPALTIRNSVLELVERPGCGGTAAFFYPAGQGNTSVDIDGLIVAGGGLPFRLTMPGAVRNLKVVDGSWFYAPTEVTCSGFTVWDAEIVRLDTNGQPVRVSTLACG